MVVRLTASVFILSSFALTALTISNAFVQKKQFYPAVVYITKNSPSMAVIYLQGIVLLMLLFQVAKYLFFGQLRAAETEHLTEKAWYAVTETCLAFTVFRDDLSPRFVVQFSMLLFLKCFHWLSEERVDFMERSPIITVLFHVRMMTLVAVLSAIDSYFVSHAYFTTLIRGASVQIVFGFEYAILMTMILHVAVKYILHMHDLRNAHPWEKKAVYLLYSELLVSFLRCMLYTVFVCVMIRLHTFPLFSVRPFYLTIRSFKRALHDIIMSRKAIHAMNTLFPLASQQELTQGDSTCIICREEMTPAGGAKKLPCQHIFHASCLRSWFQRQQTCPTCRTDILTNPTAAAHSRPAPPPANVQQNGQIPQLAQNQQHFNPFFPFVPNLAQQQPQQQQQQQPPTSSTPSSAAPQMPTIQPGSPFPFMSPFMMPPPFPFPAPPLFSGLSDSEVSEMEGRERQAIEARIASLRNIGVLLDAAAVQLQQYMSILTTLSSSPQFQAGPPASATKTTTTTTTETSMTAKSCDETFAEQQSSSSTQSSDPLDEVRQRRLHKFASPQS